MTGILAIFALLAVQGGEVELARELDRLTTGELARQYFFEWGRAGVDSLRRQFEGKEEAQDFKPEQRETVGKALDELAGIFRDHDPKAPGDTVKKMVRSSNPMTATLGFKVLTKGTFSEALPTLREADPAKAKRAEDIISRRTLKRAKPEADQEGRAAALAEAEKSLRELEESPRSRQGFYNLEGLTNVFHGEDLAAWRGWFKSNEPYIGHLGGLGVLYVDEEAKACGVPWSEWRKLPAEKREERLQGLTVPAGWKSLDLLVEMGGRTSVVLGREFDNTGSEIDPGSKALALWLYWQKKRLAEEVPGWSLKVTVVFEKDEEPATRIASRCAVLGFPSTTFRFKPRE